MHINFLRELYLGDQRLKNVKCREPLQDTRLNNGMMIVNEDTNDQL